MFAYVTDPTRFVEWQVTPLNEGHRSHLAIELDFTGHGIGKLLMPLVVRRRARTEVPENMVRLKQRLESSERG